MNTAWIQRLSAGLALAAVSAVSPSWAADDKSTVKAVTDMVGITSDQPQEKIDYSERPKLVMPPKMDVLPAPRDRTAERPPEWPSDAAVGVRRTDRFARNPNAPPEKPKPGILERLHGPHRAPDPAKANDEGGIIGSFMNLKENRARINNDDDNAVPTRRVLAEPPDGLRTPTQDLSKVVDPDTKKKSWWNFFGHEVKPIDQKKETPAQTASTPADTKPAAVEPAKEANKTEEAPAPKTGFLSSISAMMPSFSKNAEKK
jgi:hypothetical protein